MHDPDLFAWIDDAARAGDPNELFARLAERFRAEKRYRELLDIRLMQKRLELGLPLLEQPAISDLAPAVQQPYQDASVRAAREVGELLLADGHIARAWPYFRAIGDTRPVSEALDALEMRPPETPEAQEALGATIQIAFQERVNPKRGFELILEHYGLCRAITMFASYPQEEGREDALRLVLRTLCREIVDNLTRAIAEVEGAAPAGASIADLIDGRPWLFENNAQYTDSSHLAAALRFSRDLEDADTLRIALQIAEYGRHLGPMFQYVEDPPFDQVYDDHAIYLRALLGDRQEEAVAHFQQKIDASEHTHYVIPAAEALVQLLVRLGRSRDAVATFRRYLIDVPADDLACPPLPHLYQMAGDFAQLKQLAKEHSDAISYLAACLGERSTSTQSRRAAENNSRSG